MSTRTARASSTAGFRYIPTLDGWRALSVLGVICYHSLHNGLPPDGLFSRVASHGHLGVDMFFAVSGFLICGKLLTELNQTNTISLKRFYLRRFFRIIPPLWAYLAVMAVLATAGWISTKGWEFTSSLLFVRNYFPSYDGVVLGRYTAHFWSLAVEEHFYLLCPVAMLLVGARFRRLAWGALILALCVFVWRCIDGTFGWWIPYGTSIDQTTDTRIDALLWGCLAAMLYPRVEGWLKSLRWKNLWLPLGVVLIAAVLLHVPGLSLLQAMLFPALLMSTAALPESLLSRVLEWPLLRWIGRLSYSLYIWQQFAIFPVLVPHSPVAALQHFPFNIALIFLFASASYYLIEKPAIRFGRSLETRSRRTFPLGSLPAPAK
jgi:peptidoglycan/LPS O-acetylase OafA/YrhL